MLIILIFFLYKINNFLLFLFFVIYVIINFFFYYNHITPKLKNFKLLKYSLFKNNNFFKESFYIDFLQKKWIDNFLKKTLIMSSQLFNINYFFLNNIKYIYSFILNNFYILYKVNDNNIINVFFNILFFFLLFFGFFFIIFLVL